MAESLDSKLDGIINALASLLHRTAKIEGIMAGLHNEGAFVIAPSRVYHDQNSALDEASLPSSQQNLVMLQRKEPQVSIPDKFDGTHPKFRGFLNQIISITVLQPERYPTEEARVRLVGTLFT